MEENNQPQEKVVTEDTLIDYIFFTLYTNLDKNELHFERDIIAPTQLQLEPRQIEHLRELVIATGHIKSSVGFGKNGFVYLTMNGIQIMKTFKSYSAFVATQHPNHNPIAFTNETQEAAQQGTKQHTPHIANNEPLHFNENDEAS